MSLLMSCSNDEFENLNQSLTKTDVNVKSHRVPLSDALMIAENCMEEIVPKTKGLTKHVESIEYIGSSNTSTRSTACDTLFYLVNYTNDGGFALVGADDRVLPVYAISDEGHLEMSDTINNAGLAMFFRNAISTAQTRTIVIGGGSMREHEKVLTKRYQAPRLRHNMGKWSQSGYFALYCQTEDGQQSYTGCAATALGPIMAFYGWPQSYDGYNFNWGLMRSYNPLNNPETDDEFDAVFDISKLLRLLGNKENLDMKYTTGFAECDPANIKRTFSNMGYSYSPYWYGFDSAYAMNDSDEGFLCITGTDNQTGEGHVWLIDGYMQYALYTWKGPDEPIFGIDLTEKEVYPPLFHCVWGWNGKCNGFFCWDSTKSFSPGKPESFDVTDLGEYPSSHCFDIDLMYLKDIVPIK